ncbi:putative sulfate exporter family transporter [Robbsia sp. KACC 23696]|uniref:YeiH family protein n=1 Tax=Robbsia sp. KACC 23696 TaxID=3149231 RepID=UPI00325B3BB0
MTAPFRSADILRSPSSAGRVAARAAEILADIAPGLLLCVVVSGAALVVAEFQVWLFHRAWLESLVLAIMFGVAMRSIVPLSERFERGIDFCAKTVLEIAVTLLGASVSATTVLAQGAGLLGTIVAIVVLSIVMGYWVGRMLGLHHELALLVACGNAICGNSAIAAVAPIIGAKGRDVAASIAFTAVLGVIVVLLLPVFGVLMGMPPRAYGVFAGLTVYAVPQVLAATAAVSAISVQVGTLVKLVRVLMLGPVLLALSLLPSHASASQASGPRPLAWHQLCPWFVIGFLVLMGLRSADALPHAMLAPAQSISSLLTIVSMAALGLGVDIRDIARSGGRVVAAAMLALLCLGGLSLLGMRLLAM